MFIDVNKNMFVHLQIERMNPLNLHNKGFFIFMSTKNFLFISLSMIFFYVHRREQDHVRASTNRENESIESTQQRFVYLWMFYAYLYVNKNVFVYFSFNKIFFVHRREQERVRASTNRENESTESTQQRFVYLWMLYANLYANKNVIVYFSFNNIFLCSWTWTRACSCINKQREWIHWIYTTKICLSLNVICLSLC